MSSKLDMRRELEALVQEWTAKSISLRQELQQLQGQIASAQTVLVALGGTVVTGNGMPAVDLKGMTQRDALVALAKANGGRVLATSARKVLVAQGLVKDNKNASAAVFSALARCKQLRKVGRGEYSLADAVVLGPNAVSFVELKNSK